MSRESASVPTVAFNHGLRVCTWQAWGERDPIRNRADEPLLTIEGPSCVGRAISSRNPDVPVRIGHIRSGRSSTASMAGVLASRDAFAADHEGIETRHNRLDSLSPFFAGVLAELEVRRAMAGLTLDEALYQMGLVPGEQPRSPLVPAVVA